MLSHTEDFLTPYTHHSSQVWGVHGSDTVSLRNIAEYGFNRSYTGKNATAYGCGVYFAKAGNFSYSTQPQVSNVLVLRIHMCVRILRDWHRLNGTVLGR